MAAQLAHWVHRTLGLHPIESFEREFANGVRIGEILVKIDAAPPGLMRELQQRSSSSAKHANFATLRPILQSLGLRVDQKLFLDVATEHVR